MIVKAEAAKIAKDKFNDKLDSEKGNPSPDPDDEQIDNEPDVQSPSHLEEQRPRQFIARKRIEDNVAMYDFNQIREEIARTLTAAGGNVTVEIVVTGRKEDGFSENTTRSLRDNSDILGVELEDDLT